MFTVHLCSVVDLQHVCTVLHNQFFLENESGVTAFCERTFERGLSLNIFLEQKLMIVFFIDCF